MKFILPLLIIPVFCFSQSAADRQKIVATYDQTAVNELKQQAQEYMAEQRKQIDAYKATHQVEESELHSLQRIHNGVPIFFTTFNDGSSKTIRANSMYPGGALGLNVNGTGMFPGVWDGGKVRNTHNEFPNNKVTLSDAAADLSAHATHVTGTICAAGVSPTRRGIAYGASALTHDWDDDYTEMIAFGSAGYLVSNHSYGYNTDNLPNWEFGSYDGSAVEIDQLSNAYPYYQIVVAAGNDRNNGDLEQNSLKGGYDLVSGTGCSKNGITVAAVDQLLNYTDPTSVVMSDFSNFGPTDDGRIKPDISAKGVGTSSCVSSANFAYDVYSGTSMASPAITGLVVLLQNHYHNLNSAYMRASTVRGLICHSAREAGFYLGPDYEFGWGLADGLKAASIISNKGISTVLEENTLANGETFTKTVSITGAQRLSATICWTDPTGNANFSGNLDNRVPRLKNNLDLKILKDGNVYYPWKLDFENPGNPATREDDNNVDNIERVELDLADPGVYTIQVTHKGTLVGGSQVFSLIANGATTGLGVNQADFNDKIVLYPNPAKSTLNFAAPADVTISSVVVFDILGKQVNSNTSLMNNAIDISNLSSGIYFAKFMANGQSAIKKFVKE
ncbi:MAG: T9SS type A sorting domain-containing protein [Flavobacterium sp.]|nr:MAG: T9SS type A sorting domain-containing protein [Flavobacterium sp.]